MAWSRAPFRRRRSSWSLISACAGACVAWSAELLVRVQDGDGVALPEWCVSLLRVGPVPAAAGGRGRGRAARRAPREPQRGRPTRPPTWRGAPSFSGLAPGVYRVAFPGTGLDERWLLTPPAGDAVFTLPDERARAELTLVLPRGDRLVVTIETDEVIRRVRVDPAGRAGAGGRVRFRRLLHAGGQTDRPARTLDRDRDGAERRDLRVARARRRPRAGRGRRDRGHRGGAHARSPAALRDGLHGAPAAPAGTSATARRPPSAPGSSRRGRGSRRRSPPGRSSRTTSASRWSTPATGRARWRTEPGRSRRRASG